MVDIIFVAVCAAASGWTAIDTRRVMRLMAWMNPHHNFSAAYVRTTRVLTGFLFVYLCMHLAVLVLNHP